MPSLNALRRVVTRSRRSEEFPPEPQSASDVNIPNSLCNTLRGNLFLIKDRKIEQKRLLIFTTKENVRHLSNALFWIMDRTFGTVPTVFYQLYSIHAPVGSEENSRILPLVYALMTQKSEEMYRYII
jgi:hypothetical protein